MGFLTPTATGEANVLHTYGMQQLAQIRTAAYGLSDDQIAATPTASSLSIGGLLRHTGQVAVYWSTAAASAPQPPELPAEFGPEQTNEECVAAATSAAETLDYFDRCVAYADGQLRQVTDLAAAVPVPPVPWVPADLKSWEARWVLAHLIAEVARHAGHADIIRETLDGKRSCELNDLAENRPS
ncbi:MAG: hypothetical protein CSA58_06330 [Micrococcales bacterium]|nr:MAG: hypothetical protein CSB46_08535 [Micrococcales bacterium]PIE27046.1 MAG: hypothetical protein CSA58_06330 [Micrococcales bacterium]